MIRRFALIAAAVFGTLSAGTASACDVMVPATISWDQARELALGEAEWAVSGERPYRYGDYWVVPLMSDAGAVDGALYVHRHTGAVLTEDDALARHAKKVARLKAALDGAAA